MMGSERVVGARAESGSEEVSGIVPQSLVELFRLIHERMEDGGGEQEVEEGVETWAVRVGYLQASVGHAEGPGGGGGDIGKRGYANMGILTFVVRLDDKRRNRSRKKVTDKLEMLFSTDPVCKYMFIRGEIST